CFVHYPGKQRMVPGTGIPQFKKVQGHPATGAPARAANGARCGSPDRCFRYPGKIPGLTHPHYLNFTHPDCMARFIISLFFSILCGMVPAQIINIESSRKATDTAGWAGSFNVSGSYLDNGMPLWN